MVKKSKVASEEGGHKDNNDTLKRIRNLSQLISPDIEKGDDTLNRLKGLSKLLPHGISKRKKKVHKVRRVNLKRNSSGKRTFPWADSKRTKKKEIKTSAVNLDDDGSDEETVFTEDVDLETNSPSYAFLESIRALQEKSGSRIKKKRSWKSRTETSEQCWANERPRLLNFLLEKNRKVDLCQKCFQNTSVVFCKHCCLNLCFNCDDEKHSQSPFHDRVTFVNGFKQPLGPLQGVNLNKEIIHVARTVPLAWKECHCSSKLFEKETSTDIIIVVTLTGRFELLKHVNRCLSCKSAESPYCVKDIVQSGYWPCSLNSINCIIATDVFELWDQFRKCMPGSSQKAFLESLDNLTSLNGRVGKILAASFSQAFKQWLFIQYEIDILKGNDWMKCPCCTIKQHSCHIDGNLKLYRYKSSGSRLRSCFYKNFIAEDSVVDKYVSDVHEERIPKNQTDATCGGEWSAAKNVARKKGSVDYTGLEVSSCRHQFGQNAVNMKRGEIYAYALYIIKSFVIPREVTFVFADVMCKLFKYIQRVDPNAASLFKGALSVMHAKGHSIECQVVWDGEWVKGTGRSTGEETEQVFSYLSRCSNTTKYQRPEHREEHITELMMFWNRRKTLNLASSLLKKFNRVEKDLKAKVAELRLLAGSTGFTTESIDFPELLREIQDAALRVNRSPPRLTREQAAVLLYYHLDRTDVSIPESIRIALDSKRFPDSSFSDISLLKKKKFHKESVLCDSIGCLDIKNINEVRISVIQDIILPSYEREIDRCIFDQNHWNAQIRKSADSCKQRCTLRTKLASCTFRIQAIVSEYNKFSKIKIKDDFYPWQSTIFQSHTGVSGGDKRCLMETHHKLKRSEEELVLLKRDMESYLTFYTNRIATLKTRLAQLEVFPRNDVTQELGEGNQNAIREGISFCKQELKKGLKSFGFLFSPVNTELSESEESDESEEEPEKEDIVEDINLQSITSVGQELVEIYAFTINDIKTTSTNCTTSHQLPSSLCQSRINGRNGSNACSLISIIVSFCVVSIRSFELHDIIPLFIGAMEVGNNLHDHQNFLTADEARAILAPHFDMCIKEERNTILSDINDTIACYGAITRRNDVVIIVVAGITVTLVYDENRFYMFDSHSSGNFGAKIVSGSVDNISVSNHFGGSDDAIVYTCIISFLL